MKIITITILFLSFNLYAKANETVKDAQKACMETCKKTTTPELKRPKFKKPLGLILGLLPNSDGFFDNKAGFSYKYYQFQTLLNMKTVNRSELIKSDGNKNTSTFQEKTYDLNLIRMQKDSWELGYFHLSFGLGSMYTETEENISSVHKIDGISTFTDEERSSTFIQPYAQLDLLFDFGGAGKLIMGASYIPYQIQKTKTVSSVSGISGNKTSEQENEGLEVNGYLTYNMETKNNLFLLNANFQRRLNISSIVLWEKGKRTFDTADRADTVIEAELGYGLKFLSSYLAGPYPIITFSYLMTQASILAEDPEDDQKIDKNQFRFGLIMKMGEF